MKNKKKYQYKCEVYRERGEYAHIYVDADTEEEAIEESERILDEGVRSLYWEPCDEPGDAEFSGYIDVEEEYIDPEPYYIKKMKEI